MSLSEQLQNLGDSIALATSDDLDEYADWSSWTYETHMADLKELRFSIRPQLKRDLEQAEFIDTKLQQMFAAFDAGEKDKGRKRHGCCTTPMRPSCGSLDLLK